MTKTMPVAVDGIHIRLFQKDQEVVIERELGDLLVNKLKAATFIRERTMPEPSERAVLEGAPEVKEPSSIPEETEKENLPENEKGPEDYIRVFQLAKELGVSNRLILNKAKDLGIVATAPASNLSDEEIARIKKALGLGD